MSYQVLARKWRPQRFSELVGQEHVVNAISNALDNNRLHHAYLFTGTRGVGKTTIARIFAKSLNCEQGQSANPCGKCGTCVDIEQGRFVDLLEIDAASRTKVEDTRELLDNVQYRPTRGDFKVYLIDEVHMLSKHSFNALLKTLEEPPPHVKFLLATTDPQKLPITILSRCLQFNLKALSREQIATQLTHVLKQESLPFEEPALALIARSAQGSMRDALSLTDQAIAQGNNQVTKAIVTDMLGLLDKNHIYKILQALVGAESLKVISLVDELAEQAPDFSQVLQELNATLHQIALTQIVPDACKLETTHARVIYQLAKSFSPEQVQLLYQIGLDGIKTLPHAPDPRTGVEMTLLRMLAFSPSRPIQNPELVLQQQPKITEHIEPEPEHVASVQEQAAQQVIRPQPFANEPSSQPEQAEKQVVISEPMDHVESPTTQSSDLSDIDQINSLLDEQREIEQHADQMRGMTEAPVTPDIGNGAETDSSELERTKAMLALQQKMQTQNEASDEGKKPEPQPVVETSAPASSFDDDQVAPPWDSETELKPVEQEPAKLSEESESASEPSTENVVTDVKSQPQAQSVSTTENQAAYQGQPLTAYMESGKKLIHASQIDAWSGLVEKLQVGGLIKQTALHSTFVKTGDSVELTLHKNQQHLLSDSVHGQLQQALSDALQQAIQLNIQFGEPNDTPFALQLRINNMRLDYARHIAESDEAITQLTHSFNASVISDSIKPR